LKILRHGKKARELTARIYRITTMGRFGRDYGLKDQIQRASISIMANIAEGVSSGYSKSFIGFLKYSYRSASEVQSLLYVAYDCSYIQENEFKESYDDADQIKKMIGGFIQYLKTSSLKLKDEKLQVDNKETKELKPWTSIQRYISPVIPVLLALPSREISRRRVIRILSTGI
jgi:four helix bundle protein